MLFNGLQTARAIKLFCGTYVVFRLYTAVISPRYPKSVVHLYMGRNKRRIHHYETGLYLTAIGLALLLEDIKDRKQELEYLEHVKNRIQEEATKGVRVPTLADRGWLPSFHRP